jgi:hypothetical protein
VDFGALGRLATGISGLNRWYTGRPMIDAERSPARMRDRATGLIIVAAAFIAALSISWWARTKAISGAEPPAPPTTSGLVGFPTRFDAVASLDSARGITKRDRLRGISLTGAKSDGTVDVSRPGATVRYTFSSNRGEGPQPPRPPGTMPKRNSCGRQSVLVKADGMVADKDQPDHPCLDRGDALPSPRCGPKEVWKHAITKGAPADKLATIDYLRATAGPAWKFQIPGTPHEFVLYGDCERELMGAEAYGTLP